MDVCTEARLFFQTQTINKRDQDPICLTSGTADQRDAVPVCVLIPDLRCPNCTLLVTTVTL
jgi:hypothetical protein